VKGLTEEQYLEEIEQRDLRIAALENENKLLREKVDLLVKKVFGSSSEKLNSAQLTLLGLNEENVPGKSDASSDKPQEAAPQFPVIKAKQPKRPKGIPAHLPVVEEIIEPQEVQDAPEKWRQIGQEVSDQLDYTPGRFFKRRLIRRKYVSVQDKDAAPIIAELPAKLICERPAADRIKRVVCKSDGKKGCKSGFDAIFHSIA
jgi:transposase